MGRWFSTIHPQRRNRWFRNDAPSLHSTTSRWYGLFRRSERLREVPIAGLRFGAERTRNRRWFDTDPQCKFAMENTEWYIALGFWTFETFTGRIGIGMSTAWGHRIGYRPFTIDYLSNEFHSWCDCISKEQWRKRSALEGTECHFGRGIEIVSFVDSKINSIFSYSDWLIRKICFYSIKI